MTDEIRTEPETVATAPEKPRPRLDKRTLRRAEIKKHKRKAHRRRINASNRPG